MKNYYISDLHLGHTNCLEFDNRPFHTCEEQDKVITENWNKIVTPKDHVYILGDVSWYKRDKTQELLGCLNGHKHLIIGNHDRDILKWNEVIELFDEVCHYKELKDEGKHVVLSHYPIPCFNRHHYGAYHFYGHVHVSTEYDMMKEIQKQMVELYDKPCNMFNVGVMIPYMDYTPRTLKEIDEKG